MNQSNWIRGYQTITASVSQILLRLKVGYFLNESIPNPSCWNILLEFLLFKVKPNSLSRKLENQYYWFTRIIFNPIQLLGLKHKSKINHFLCSLFKGQILGFKDATSFLSVNWNSCTDSAMLVHINRPLK